MTLVLGVDPGLSGAICRYEAGSIPTIYDMPTLALTRGGKNKREIDAHKLVDMLRYADHAFVEYAGAMPGQGVSAVFAFGKTYGIILGILAAVDVPYTVVAPRKWKTALQVPAEKDGARARASQLMPSAAHLWPRVKDDGKAEAALISLYGWQTLAK